MEKHERSFVQLNTAFLTLFLSLCLAPPHLPCPQGVDAQSPGKRQEARPPLLPPGLTGANWEVIVAGRTLLTVVSSEVGPAGTAAGALLTVLRVLRVAAAG